MQQPPSTWWRWCIVLWIKFHPRLYGQCPLVKHIMPPYTLISTAILLPLSSFPLVWSSLQPTSKSTRMKVTLIWGIGVASKVTRRFSIWRPSLWYPDVDWERFRRRILYNPVVNHSANNFECHPDNWSLILYQWYCRSHCAAHFRNIQG